MSDVWTWYGWRCGHALRRDPAHHQALPADECALRRLLTRVARRRGRWLVVDASNGRTFGQCFAVGHGLLGVELSAAPLDNVVWPLQPLPAPELPAAVRLRNTGKSLPVWCPPRALYDVRGATNLIARHLAGHLLPPGYEERRVDVR